VQAQQEEGVLSALVLESTSGGLIAPTAVPQTAKLGAYLILANGLLRLWNPNKEALERIVAELQQRSGRGLSEARRADRPVMFGDVVAQGLTFPVGLTDKAEVEKRIHQEAERYFEEAWIHRPLKSLSQVPPIDAAGSGTLRKKLTGVVQFLQECAAGGALQTYDFDRLRRKLGLLDGQPAAPPVGGEEVVDISALGAAELAALKASGLSSSELQDAFQAANKLAAHELAGHFARELIGRPPEPQQPDRFAVYSHLIQAALGEGNTEAALKSVDEGERHDREHNEGKRHNDYELRRGQIHVKRKEATQAQEVFQRLIEGAATNLRYRGTAAEAMLALKQPAQALRFAESGLAEARKQNERDSEQYFLELVGAARKQGG
jgi:tetratricopeptide (TPR) repeat protein